MITVCIVNYNSSHFLEATLINLKRLSKFPYSVEVIDNGSDAANLEHLQKLKTEYPSLNVSLRQSHFNGRMASFAHGEALDLLLNRVTTPYALVLDADCIPLLPNWDEVLISAFTEKIAVIGAVPPKETVRRKFDFPLPFFALIDMTKYRTLGISCMPRNIEKGEDTCWEWREKMLSAGFIGKAFESFSTRVMKQGPFGKFTGVEEYYWDRKLIASHFGRGSTAGEAKFLKKVEIPFVSRFVRRVLGRLECQGWINQCKAIGLNGLAGKIEVFAG